MWLKISLLLWNFFGWMGILGIIRGWGVITLWSRWIKLSQNLSLYDKSSIYNILSWPPNTFWDSSMSAHIIPSWFHTIQREPLIYEYVKYKLRPINLLVNFTTLWVHKSTDHNFTADPISVRSPPNLVPLIHPDHNLWLSAQFYR